MKLCSCGGIAIIDTNEYTDYGTYGSGDVVREYRVICKSCLKHTSWKTREYDAISEWDLI
jgi:hypothetical protein